MYDINCPEDFDGDISVATTPLSGKDYYNGTDCFDAIRKFLGEDGTKAWIKGNVLKYLYRYNGKDGLSDLNKALEYLSMLLEMEIRK